MRLTTALSGLEVALNVIKRNACAQPVLNRVRWNAQCSTPFLDRPNLPIEINQSDAASVVILRCGVCPADIPRLITPATIYPIKRKTLTRARPNVGIERSKTLSPFTANRHPGPAVSSVANILRPVASTNHTPPRLIFGRSLHPVLLHQTTSHLSSETATRTRPPFPQRLSRYQSYRAAVAATPPHSGGPLSRIRRRDHLPPTKSLSCQLNRFTHRSSKGLYV